MPSIATLVSIATLRRRLLKKKEKENDGDPSMELLVDRKTTNNVRIIIRGINGMTPRDDQRSIKERVHADAMSGRWDPSIYDNETACCVGLSSNGDTALHIAVSAKRTSFVRNLVSSEHTNSKYLETRNSDGNTAFCLAAILGDSDSIQCMMNKNENLPLIPGHDEMLPVHLAALAGHHQLVLDLISPQNNLLHNMTLENIQRLFFITIKGSMYDVATALFKLHPAELAIATHDQDKLTALHMLVRKTSLEDKKDGKEQKWQAELDAKKFELLKELWDYIRRLDNDTCLDLIIKPPNEGGQKKKNKRKPSTALVDAVKLGNVDAVKLFLSTKRELLAQQDSDKHNILHLAALYRQKEIFDLVLKIGTSNILLQAVDKDGNNVLHLAAYWSKETSSSKKASYNQMRQDLEWFEKVKKRVPKELMKMRNKKDETPTDTFYAAHTGILKDVKDEAKGIANSGMVVAALIASVVFSAALNNIGDKGNNWFDVFFLMNAVALFTSSASIVYFLAIFTSSWSREYRFLVSLLPRLEIGFAISLLCVSIFSMVISFIAASFLIYEGKNKRFAIGAASVGSLAIGSIIYLICSLVNALRVASWSSL